MADGEVNIQVGIEGQEKVSELQAKIDALQQKIDQLDKKNKGASVSSQGLSDKLTKVKAGAIAARIGILAMTTAIIAFMKSSYEAAMAQENMSQAMKSNVAVIKEHEAGWKRLKEGIGEGIVAIRASVIVQREAMDQLNATNALMGLNYSERQKLIEQTKEQIRAEAELNVQLGKNIESYTAYLKVAKDVESAQQKRIDTSDLEIFTQQRLFEMNMKKMQLENDLAINSNKYSDSKKKQIEGEIALIEARMEKEIVADSNRQSIYNKEQERDQVLADLKKKSLEIDNETTDEEQANMDRIAAGYEKEIVNAKVLADLKMKEAEARMKNVAAINAESGAMGGGSSRMGNSNTYIDASGNVRTREQAAQAMKDYVFKTGPNAGQSQSSLGQTSSSKVASKAKTGSGGG